jgi:hypothetical protein
VKYLLSFYQPTGGEPDPELLERVMADLGTVNDDLRAAGKWVFGGGLHAPDTATVLRLKGGDVAATDGPFSEGKEHLGGITIIEADDLDEALGWAGRIARATTLPIEVRPFQH